MKSDEVLFTREDFEYLEPRVVEKIRDIVGDDDKAMLITELLRERMNQRAREVDEHYRKEYTERVVRHKARAILMEMGLSPCLRNSKQLKEAIERTRDKAKELINALEEMEHVTTMDVVPWG